MANEMEEIDLSLLDKNLSDIEDLPGFDVPPNGSYTLLANASTKKINKELYVVIDLAVVDTLQLADEQNSKPPLQGTQFGVIFNLANEYGLNNLKKTLTPIGEHFGTDNLRTLVTEKIQNLMLSATVVGRAATKDASKIYATLKNISVM